MDKMVIWPAFIDSDLSRSQGRRLPHKLCVKNPKVEEMLEAATGLGLKSEIAKKAYPRMWYAENRALLLNEKLSRSEVIRRIAEEVRRRRSQ